MARTMQICEGPAKVNNDEWTVKLDRIIGTAGVAGQRVDFHFNFKRAPRQSHVLCQCDNVNDN